MFKSRVTILKWLLLFGTSMLLVFILLYYCTYFLNTKNQTETEAHKRLSLKTNKLCKPILNPSWHQVASSTNWSPRDSATSFVFRGKMWIMGGLNGNKAPRKGKKVYYWDAPHFNDIWSSENGRRWKLIKEHAEWSPRRSMSVVFFKNKLWMLGGWSPVGGYVNEIWRSSDGTNWQRVVKDAPWPAREGQKVEVFRDKIWVIGGVNYDEYDTKNDVWYSSDGIHWKQVKTDILWHPRWDHATAVFNNKLFLVGGMNLNDKDFKDVWASSDGMHWNLVTNTPAWKSRQGHSLVNLRGKLWLIGRLNDKDDGVNDVWYSKEGAEWQIAENYPPWSGREDHSTLSFKDKIYVFGGMDSKLKWHNDIWSFSPHSSISKNKGVWTNITPCKNLSRDMQPNH